MLYTHVHACTCAHTHIYEIMSLKMIMPPQAPLTRTLAPGTKSFFEMLARRVQRLQTKESIAFAVGAIHKIRLHLIAEETVHLRWNT